MAVTRADREVELQQLEKAFKGTDTAVLVDYKGMNVPQVTELRRQLRTAKASYKVVKNTLAKRALKGTPLEVLEQYFAGTTAVARSAEHARFQDEVPVGVGEIAEELLRDNRLERLVIDGRRDRDGPERSGWNDDGVTIQGDGRAGVG